MRRHLVPFAALTVVFGVAACETAPVTGRNQLILMSDQQARQLGADAYQQILGEKNVVGSGAQYEMVQRVGRRLVQANDTGEQDWEFNLIEDETANAFALPGGKVGVHTGLFDVAKTEPQLAAVLAHELAHVTAAHSAERYSQQMLVQGGLAGLGIAGGAENQQLVKLASLAATLGVTLPFGRNQEAEADHIGLTYMARAGYDPRAAVDVWQNFQSAGGERPPEFLSTHPSPGSRIDRLQSLMPAALEIYRRNS